MLACWCQVNKVYTVHIHDVCAYMMLPGVLLPWLLSLSGVSDSWKHRTFYSTPSKRDNYDSYVIIESLAEQWLQLQCWRTSAT